MNKNQEYIRNVKVEEVIWDRLTTAYIRVTSFPDYFHTIWEMSNRAEVKSALDEILLHIEHQGILWRATPFSMIFLARIFEKAVAEKNKNDIADDIVKILLKFFILMAEIFQDTKKIDHPEPLPYFGDLLNEENLFPEKCNEEEDIFWEEEIEGFSEELSYSLYYYSYQVLLSCKEILKEIDDVTLKEQVQKLQSLLD